jgi:hypothetical protein
MNVFIIIIQILLYKYKLIINIELIFLVKNDSFIYHQMNKK